MSFLDSIKTCLVEKPFTFKGRASRSELWWFFLFFYLGLFLLVYPIDHLNRESVVTKIGSYALLMVALYLLIAYISVTVRRLHDISQSGWNIFWRLIPCVGALLVLFMLCQKGDKGDNDYGPNPLNKGEDVPQDPDEQNNDDPPQQPEASTPSQPYVEPCPAITRPDTGDKVYTSSYLNSISWQEWNNIMAKELNDAGFRRRNSFSSTCEMVEYEAPDDYPKGFILGVVDGYEEIEFLKKRRLLNNGRCPMCGKAITVPGSFTSGFDSRMSFQICQNCVRNKGRIVVENKDQKAGQSKENNESSCIPKKALSMMTQKTSKTSKWIIGVVLSCLGIGLLCLCISKVNNHNSITDSSVTLKTYMFNDAFRMSIPDNWKFDAMSCPKSQTSSVSKDNVISYDADFDRGSIMFVPIGSNVTDNFAAGVFPDFVTFFKKEKC